MATLHDPPRDVYAPISSWSMRRLVKQKLSIPSGNVHGLELSCIGFQPDDAKSTAEGGEGDVLNRIGVESWNLIRDGRPLDRILQAFPINRVRN